MLRRLHKPLQKAQRRYAAGGKPARAFAAFGYRTRHSWRRKRRVVGKAERLAKGANPRFVAPSLSTAQYAARRLYEKLY